MSTEPQIITITEKKLVGMRINTSLSDDKTTALWQQFMPRRNEIKNKLESGFYDVKVYPSNFEMKDFTPQTIFEKWAAIEVSLFNQIPNSMESYTIKGGKYAVFMHKGPASSFHKTLQYIFGVWLPDANYTLDNRAHFEIMGETYKPDDPNAEEEVWIPIKWNDQDE